MVREPTHRSKSWHFAKRTHPNLVGFDKVVALFKTAEKDRDFVRVVLPLHKSPKTQLVLQLAKTTLMGFWQIEINIKAYGSGDFIYYGVIDEEAVLRPSSALRQTDRDEKRYVWQLLCRLRDNPSAVLSTLGKETGVCCYCNRELTDEKSVRAGFGPRCAKRFNLVHARPFDVTQFTKKL